MDKRIISLLLVLIMLAPSVVSCSESSVETSGGEVSDTSADTENTVQDVLETENRLACLVPDDMKLGGESVGILTSDVYPHGINVDEINGDLLNDAMFEANAKVMKYLECTFDFIENGSSGNAKLVQAITAGDEVYDIVYDRQWSLAPLVLRKFCANLNSSAGGYIDYEKPWWYSNYIDETEVDETHTYLLAGEASPSVILFSSMMILNTDMLVEQNIDVNDIYQTVLEGEWTYDEMSELVAGQYRDKNGNGERDLDDIYGFSSPTRSDVEHFLIAAGVRACSRDENGTPYVSINNETTYKFVEKLVEFLWQNDGSYYAEGLPIYDMLANNQALLVSSKFGELEYLRESDSNYTVIPMPKLDTGIESYSSLVHDSALVITIPMISSQVEEMTAMLEKLAYYYYYDVMPLYYETVLKVKYRRDSSEAAAQVIDIIHEGMTTDFAYIYNSDMNNIIQFFRDFIGVAKRTNYAAMYAKFGKMYDKGLNEVVRSIMGDD